MADQCDCGVVGFGFGQQDSRADLFDNRFELIESSFVNSLLQHLLNHEGISRAVEEIGSRVFDAGVFAARHRVAADERHARRQRLTRDAADFDFSAAGVGDYRARFDLR
ncbi:MAG: hypothetical protein JMDDDDMK_03549 [Acidobacteria bacterium]|nr:hypothetical protein [Acidobacteriota bacterium]